MTTDPLVGKHLGAYQILEPIGQGGMATVYKAMQSAMNRVVAVKILSPQMAANSVFLARFKQEAQMIASLEHAHILPVYDMGEQDGIIYIAMRFMGFGSIQSRLAAGAIPLRDLTRWLDQMASALDYAHERGVIHRDVKPSNVLLDAQGDAYLADFGIAKWMAGSIQLTGSAVIGTPQYMSPEQGQGLKIDGRSDEYSLAVMAYEMIVGRPPFEAETPLAIVLKHVTEPLTPPATINPRVPNAVSDVICKALNKDPDDRYPTSTAFAEALAEAVRSSPIAGTAQLPPSAQPTEAVHRTAVPVLRKRYVSRPIAIALAMLLIVALGMGGVVLISANAPTPERPNVAVTLGSNVVIQTLTPAVTAVPPPPPTEFIVSTSDSCKPIFAESFDNPSARLPSGEQEGAVWGTVEGEYRLLIKSANFYQSRLIGQALKDYELNIDAHFASEALGDYGVMLAARSADDYIAFVVDGQQNYAITRRTPDESKVIQDWTFAPALNRGQTPNHLRVIQRGRDIALYANGVLLKLITDDGDPQTDRQIGLTAASFGRGGVDARFDNLRVCEAPSAFSTNRVTLIDAFDDNRNGWAPQKYSSSGISSIENGQFIIDALYAGKSFGWSDWNPNVAFNDFDLDIDLQMTGGVTTSQIGLLFGVQDLGNTYVFSLINDGRFRLYRVVDGSYQTLADDRSAAIKPNLALNHVHMSIVTGTLTVAVNQQQVLQAAVAYAPGFVGFWCGVDAPKQTRCTFDNLSATGTPSTGPLTIYPFCNCRREARVHQPLVASWLWRAKTEALANDFRTTTTLTVTLDGKLIEQPKQYWGKLQPDEDGAALPWRFDLPQLDPGSHVLNFTVHSDRALTDGRDLNGDGKPDTYGPGDIYVGYVEVVVQP